MVRAQMAKKCARFCPAHPPHVHQPQIDLVDQGGGLQGVASPFIRHITVRRPVQFLVHQRGQPLQCLPVPVAPGPEQLRDALV